MSSPNTKPIRYRPHTASLAESLKTVELRDRADLVEHLRSVLDHYNEHWTPPDPITVFDDLVYIKGYDDGGYLSGWKNVHVVIVKGWGVMGFCELSAIS
jgi:hypothetical protein